MPFYSLVIFLHNSALQSHLLFLKTFFKYMITIRCETLANSLVEQLRNIFGNFSISRKDLKNEQKRILAEREYILSFLNFSISTKIKINNFNRNLHTKIFSQFENQLKDLDSALNTLDHLIRCVSCHKRPQPFSFRIVVKNNFYLVSIRDSGIIVID